ncbi:MAG: TolC family protein, partial [Deltaproteobacteria bacterium]
VAEAQVGAAQEAYRVTQALSGAGSATTTDLLDAQSALTEARTALVRARYEAAIASVTLGRAAGRDD